MPIGILHLDEGQQCPCCGTARGAHYCSADATAAQMNLLLDISKSLRSIQRLLHSPLVAEQLAVTEGQPVPGFDEEPVKVGNRKGA